jgi:hypothetical protein
LQPLLTIERFCNLSRALSKNAGESDEIYSKRCTIFSALKQVLTAYRENSTSEELGQSVARLRSTMFTAGLAEGGFINPSEERGYQDAGSFFELILHVIGQGFQLNSTRTYMLPGGRHLPKSETTPQGVLFLKELTGSVQDRVNAYAQNFKETVTLSNALRYTPPGSTEQLFLKTYTETNRITTAPKDLLVFRVENHVVNPSKDRFINCSSLFEGNPVAQYELVGFAQNDSQVHWTSVVFRDGTWIYCNDDKIRKVEATSTEFRSPANYLVYKLRSGSS